MARDLRLFYVFRLLATSYLWVPIFWHFMDSRGLGFDDIMWLSAIYSAVVISVEIPTGALADRIGRRESMMVGALAMVASCLVAYNSYSFSSFAAAEVLAAFSMSLCSGADSAYLFDLLQANGRTHEYPRRETTSSAWHQAGSAGAFALGGVLGQYVDLGVPYLATAVVAGLAFVVALFMRPENHCLGRQKRSDCGQGEFREYGKHMKESLRDIKARKGLIWVLAFSAVAFVLLRATVYLYQPFLKARGFSIVETGFIFAGVYLVATFVAHRGDTLRRMFGEMNLAWALLAMMALSFCALNSIAGQWALGLLVVQAFANGLYSPLVKIMLNREIPDSSRRATVLSVESIVRRVAMGIFSPIAGFYGPSSAMYLCGITGVLGMVALAIWVRHCPARKGRQPAEATLVGGKGEASQSAGGSGT